MDYKEKFISLINDKTLPIEQRKKLEEIYNSIVESEDEKIRKQIISFLKEFEYHYRNLDFSSWIAWLEKQGELPRKISIWKHWKDGIAGNGEGKQIFLIKIGIAQNNGLNRSHRDKVFELLDYLLGCLKQGMEG